MRFLPKRTGWSTARDCPSLENTYTHATDMTSSQHTRSTMDRNYAFNQERHQGCGCSSAAECLPSPCEALGSTPAQQRERSTALQKPAFHTSSIFFFFTIYHRVLAPDQMSCLRSFLPLSLKDDMSPTHESFLSSHPSFLSFLSSFAFLFCGAGD